MESKKFKCPECGADLTDKEINSKECWTCGEVDIKPKEKKVKAETNVTYNSIYKSSLLV
jgi:predicted RNA-binding Zn-ribbon protein involved in translation (DUF1610 family)